MGGGSKEDALQTGRKAADGRGDDYLRVIGGYGGTASLSGWSERHESPPSEMAQNNKGNASLIFSQPQKI